MFSKQVVFILLNCLFNSNSAQITGIVTDSITHRGIPYVNIWIENEPNGTTANESGEFKLEYSGTKNRLVLSAISYESRTVVFGQAPLSIKLKPKTTELSEVVVVPRKNKQISIGTFKKSKIQHYFACGTLPWISARYFTYEKRMNETPFLKEIKVLTGSATDGAKFNIRLYSVSPDGSPGEYLSRENIIGVASKGNRITVTDLSKLHVRIPENGIFVAIEWLIVESNEHKHKIMNSGKKAEWITYDPSLGTIPMDNSENSWSYTQGSWKRIFKTISPLKNYADKYPLLAMELVLSN